MDLDVSPAGIEELLGHFVTAALGLTLDGRILDPSKLPPEHRGCLIDSMGRPRAWIAWHTDEGTVSACALYDRAQSARMNANVLLLSTRRIGRGKQVVHILSLLQSFKVA